MNQYPIGSKTEPTPDCAVQVGQCIRDDVKLKFATSNEFLNVLRGRVDEYFRSTRRRRRDCVEMYLKSVAIVVWCIVSYLLLVAWATTWWQALLLAISLGLAMACVGFNIQHDGAHAAYSKHKCINKLAAMALDLLGGSSYVWKKTHNQVHHTYTNVTGHDGDIDLGILGRLSPHQRRLKVHRLQHVYLWFLYGFLTIKWQFYDDTRVIIEGRIGKYRLVRPRRWELVVLCGGKLLFISWALVIPSVLHPWSTVLLLFFVASFVQGLLLSVVFQLAHCVEQADFPMSYKNTGRMESTWAEHQVETTVNFARRNRVITWFVGGLNYQIEHHLFPQICHVNYPDITDILEETCREFDVRYTAHDTLSAAVASHFRWLRRMGRPPDALERVGVN